MTGSHAVSLSPQEALKLLDDFLVQRRWGEGEALAREILKVAPRLSHVLVALGTILENTGRFDEAVATYDEAIRYHPGAGLPFTRRSLSLLRRHWGPPRQPRASRPGACVTCSQLGTQGRFGNQLLQYAVTRLYADKCGIEAQFPDWLGRDLFDLDDPLIMQALPPISEQDVDILGILSGRIEGSLTGHDIRGYFMQESADYAPYRAAFTKLFQPGERLAARTKAWRAAIGENHTVIALHLRRGDYGYGPYWIAPEAWYLDWLAQIWPQTHSPLLFIATEDRAVLSAFKAYNPVTALDLGDQLPGADFYCDFYILSQADALAISNSSFSFVAAMLNTRARDFFRPEKRQQTLLRFDPWNAPLSLRYTA